MKFCYKRLLNNEFHACDEKTANQQLAEKKIWPFWPFLCLNEALQDFLVGGFQELWNDACLSGCRYKIGVTGPPGNEMQMKVTFYSSPSTFSNIYPYIESLRLINIRQAFFTSLCQEHHFLNLFRLS